MRLRLAALTLVVLLLAAACGGNDDGPAPPGAPASAEATPLALKQLGTSTGIPHTILAPDFVALPGATAHFGTLDGAAYQVEIPDDWNGELVLYAHGVRLTGDEVFVSDPLGPLRELFIEQGYAWAASSYSENFYVPGIGADDSMALLQHFRDEYGVPTRTYLVGESMGGNVAALLLENYPGVFDGALAICGALGGEEQIDYLVSWAMAAEFASGVRIPVGEGQAAMALTVFNELPAVLGTPGGGLTAPGLVFRSIIEQLTGGPRPGFEVGFSAQFSVNFALLIFDPDRRLVPVAAATNESVVYQVDESLGIGTDELNAGIRRLSADPAARDAAAHPDAVPTSGEIADPLLTLHNTGDVFVPITQEVAYRAKADAAGNGELLVQRAIQRGGHCQFSEGEYTAAWNDLVAWVKEGARPAGDDFTAPLAGLGAAFTESTP